MNRKLTAITGAILCAGLAACSAPRNAQELSQKTVQYGCGPGASQPMSVQYTFQGKEALAAKIIYQNQAVDLTRSTTTNADVLGNTFRGNGYTWTTDKFNEDTVGQAAGNMLTRDAQQFANTPAGQPAPVSNILIKDCRPTAVS